MNETPRTNSSKPPSFSFSIPCYHTLTLPSLQCFKKNMAENIAKNYVEICNTCSEQRARHFRCETERDEEWDGVFTCTTCGEETQCSLYAVVRGNIAELVMGGSIAAASRKRNTPEVPIMVLPSILQHFQENVSHTAPPDPSSPVNSVFDKEDESLRLRENLVKLTRSHEKLKADYSSRAKEIKELRGLKGEFKILKEDARRKEEYIQELLEEIRTLKAAVTTKAKPTPAERPRGKPKVEVKKVKEVKPKVEVEVEVEQHSAVSTTPPSPPASPSMSPTTPQTPSARSRKRKADTALTTPPANKTIRVTREGRQKKGATDRTMLDWRAFGLNDELARKKTFVRARVKIRPPLNRAITFMQIIRYYSPSELRNFASGLGFSVGSLNKKNNALAYDLWSYMIKGTIAPGAGDDESEEEDEEEEEEEDEERQPAIPAAAVQDSVTG